MIVVCNFKTTIYWVFRVKTVEGGGKIPLSTIVEKSLKSQKVCAKITLGMESCFLSYHFLDLRENSPEKQDSSKHAYE